MRAALTLDRARSSGIYSHYKLQLYKQALRLVALSFSQGNNDTPELTPRRITLTYLSFACPNAIMPCHRRSLCPYICKTTMKKIDTKVMPA